MRVLVLGATGFIGGAVAPGALARSSTDTAAPPPPRRTVPAHRAVAAGQEVVVLCPTVVFGPGDVKPTTGLTLLALRRGLMPAYIEGVINIVDVRDVAQAHVTALERGRSGERYILGGHNTNLG